MKKDIDIVKIGKNVIVDQLDSLIELRDRIGDNFKNVVELIINCSGRLIIIGLGKSGIIGRKISATLNSTGTVSSFIHASDALHGDSGHIKPNDIVLFISKSGNTYEIKQLILLVQNMDIKIIGMTSNLDSYLGTHADELLDVSIKKEACPDNLVPTTSTTMQLVMGDALAISLLRVKKFSKEDFAKFHPGGILGKKLTLRVSELCDFANKPEVCLNDHFEKIIMEISSKRLGATAVLDNNTIVGIITDGDVRRVLEDQSDVKNICAKDFMTNAPKIVEKTMLAYKAFSIMKKHSITQLLVVDNKKYLGLVHLHDILKHDIF